MFHLDLKRTEIAIAAGRLDEAWSILQSSSQREHRDGQRLVDQLITALVERGNQHLEENRVEDAWHDADVAARLGGRQINVARLLDKIKAERDVHHQRAVVQHVAVPPTPVPQPASERNVRPPMSPLQNTNASVVEPAVLQVDGLGSILVLASDTVSIGIASSRTRHDIAVQTEGESATMWVTREGEDYFVKSSQPFLVNGRSTTRRLLSGDDTISIGKRGRLRFGKPVLASGSATLEITGAKLVRRDIRKIALMADSLLFGSAGCHFAAAIGETPVIMRPCKHSTDTDCGDQGNRLLRADGLCSDGYWLHRQGSFDRQRLVVGSGAFGASVSFNDCNFTLTPFSSSKPIV